MQAKRFFYTFLASTSLALLLLGGFNGFIDPLQLFASPRLDGINLHKSEWFFSQYLTRPAALQRAQADGLLMGTSRTGFTMDPSHPAWDGYQSFNYALAGSTMLVHSHSLRAAQNRQPLRRVALGLDLFMFNACRQQHLEKPVQDYLLRLPTAGGQSNWRRPQRLIRDYAASLLSLDTTRAQSAHDFPPGGLSGR